jgi:hypothetical protein
VQVNVMQVGELSARNCSYLQNDRVLRVEPRRQLEALLSRAAHHRQAFRKYCALSSAAALERDEFSGSLSSLAKGLFSGGGGGLGGIASAFTGLAGGFADGGLINGDGTPTSDSNVALVSDGEFIVNAKAASKNRALLAAVNSGKAPKFSGSSRAGFLTSNIHAPTVNVHV